MTRHRIAILLAGGLFACSAPPAEAATSAAPSREGTRQDARQPEASRSPAAEQQGNQSAGDKKQAKKDDKTDDKKDDKKQAAVPACMHCGATCGLEPICVCEPGTKKRPRTTFETTCDPICVPGCGSRLWPGRGAPGCTGCTSCTDRGPEPCSCPGQVKQRKKLKKETTDEEVPTVVQKVAYVCDGCAGEGGGCVGAAPAAGRPSWWHGITRWWPWLTRGRD